MSQVPESDLARIRGSCKTRVRGLTVMPALAEFEADLTCIFWGIGRQS